MGDIHIVIQPELIFSLIIITVLSIFFILAGRQIKAADPTKRPTGIVLVCETGVKMIQDYMATLMPAQFSKNYYPYFAMMFIYIFISNISGLFGFEAPTSNYSITLAITIITFTLIQYNALKTKGVFTYIKDIIWPPTNILGTLAPLISLSMRLFGNIVAGSILLSLIYSFTGYLSEYVINFNFLGPLIAPIFHAYFDVFAGFIQTLVFVTLSSILIALEVNED
ncbi:F0F1 ATP synthase subunit A [uncultured Thomasclavelia sp.]|uniref:F0F1 ATP synthase subunit A n=1 Tax=uncultured Thomasclavelia sp. TaxID=3025759 RepID=UPI00280AB122|nr:F0F1 ATP synthase subunit A [uncultured Thomasclavelia sp.]